MRSVCAIRRAAFMRCLQPRALLLQAVGGVVNSCYGVRPRF
ncbi:MAG: hypothetical protein JWQ33_1338 [Ramlibacter sp.]|nr:hypothetical protein [Ramlibacter sp.]